MIALQDLLPCDEAARVKTKSATPAATVLRPDKTLFTCRLFFFPVAQYVAKCSQLFHIME